MTESQITEQTSITTTASVRGTKKKKPWNAFLWKAIGEVVAFLPSYRDTREGRKKAKQMRLLFVGAGIILMAIGGTADEWGGFWIIFGLVLACLAFIAPVEDLKKRAWRTKITKKKKPQKQPFWESGSVVINPRRVEIHDQSSKVRHVRIDREKHTISLRTYNEHPCLGILPPGKKKNRSIWICSTGPIDQPIETQDRITDDEMDRPAKVDPSDWEELWQALQQRA